MIEIRKYNFDRLPFILEEKNMVAFLFRHLEQYGDAEADIQKAVDYALQRDNKPGGLLIAAYEDDVIIGAVVVNQTGMQDYIPENILVYIATHNEHRGKGIGKQLMAEAIQYTQGSIALHVEPDNPAKKLYESMGFTNKYLEMRLRK